MTLHSPGAPLVPFHLDDKGELVQGTGGKKSIKPYVRFNLTEIKNIPTHSVVVWILLMRQWHATKKEWVTIPKRIRQEVGIPRRQIARGLKALEDEGFVELEKEKGRSTQVRKCR